MNHIDFLPASYHEQLAQHGIVYRRWVLLSVTAVFLIGWGVMRHNQTADLRHSAQLLRSQVQDAQRQQSEMAKLQQDYASLGYQLKIQRQLDQPVALSQSVSTLGQLLPDSTGLTWIQVKTFRPPPKPLVDPDEKPNKRRKAKKDQEPIKDHLEIEVKGIAPDDVIVAHLVNSMSDHRLFEQVKMHFSRAGEHNGLLGRRFHVGAQVPLDRRYVRTQQSAEVPDED